MIIAMIMRVVYYLGIAMVVVWAISYPAEAGGLIHNVIHVVKEGASGIHQFIQAA